MLKQVFRRRKEKANKLYHSNYFILNFNQHRQTENDINVTEISPFTELPQLLEY